MVLSKSYATPRTSLYLAINILGNFQDTEKSDQQFHYRSVIGKLNYLENITQPDIAYAVHQCA